MSRKSTSLLAALLSMAAPPALAFGLPAGINDGTMVLESDGLVSGSAVNDISRHFPTSPGLYSAGTSAAGTTMGTLEIIDTPTPGLVSTLTIDPAGASSMGSGSVFGTIIYSIEVFGAAGTAASVHVGGLGDVGFDSVTSALVTDGGRASADFSVTDSGQSLVLARSIDLSGDSLGYVDNGSDFVGLPTSVPTPFSFLHWAVDEDLMLNANEIYTVAMRTTLQATASISGEVSLHASIDPTFTVRGPFSIEASDGFGGVTTIPAAGGVPEPATWALMLAGFGAVGAGLRRPRRAALRSA